MKCLEFVQMHGKGPVANRSVLTVFRDNRVEMFGPMPPGVGGSASGIFRRVRLLRLP
jgi:hypothetical protein